MGLVEKKREEKKLQSRTQFVKLFFVSALGRNSVDTI